MKLADLKGKTVGVCVSGGLDSKTICCVLKDAGVKVKAFSANVGQPDEKDINDIKKKMAPTGVQTTIVDVTKEMADIRTERLHLHARVLENAANRLRVESAGNADTDRLALEISEFHLFTSFL